MKKRSEIRIIDPPKELLEAIKKLAQEEKRTIGKQAEYLIELQLKKKNTRQVFVPFNSKVE